MITKKSGSFRGIILMIFSAICVCFGQMFWKMSEQSNLLFLCLGFLLYGIGALLMLVSYKYGELSKLQPLLSLNYPLSIIIAYFAFSESITPLKIAGMLFISCGVLFISQTTKDREKEEKIEK